MTGDAVEVRLANLEKDVGEIEDYAAVRERGLRNERELAALRGDVTTMVKGVRDELAAVRTTVNDLTKTLATAAISFALSAIAIVATLVTLFR